MSSLQGDPAKWLPGLQEAGDVMLSTLIPAAWSELTLHGIDTSVHEDKITNLLLFELRKVKRENLPDASFRVEGQYQVNPATDDTGRVDIAVIYGGHEGLYLAYECKWLEKKSQERDLAKKYLGKEGLGRFLSGKYGYDMPFGCMIGYVVTGDLTVALNRISDIIKSKGLPQPTPSKNIHQLKAFKTDHTQNPVPISITHILLPCT